MSPVVSWPGTTALNDGFEWIHRVCLVRTHSPNTIVLFRSDPWTVLGAGNSRWLGALTDQLVTRGSTNGGIHRLGEFRKGTSVVSLGGWMDN